MAKDADYFTLWEIQSPPGLLQGSHVWLLRGACSPKFRYAMGVFSFSFDRKKPDRRVARPNGIESAIKTREL